MGTSEKSTQIACVCVVRGWLSSLQRDLSGMARLQVCGQGGVVWVGLDFILDLGSLLL